MYIKHDTFQAVLEHDMACLMCYRYVPVIETVRCVVYQAPFLKPMH